MTYLEFFQTATHEPDRADRSPYDYQCRLACGPAARAANPATLTTGTDCQSQLINIPTGLGKTAAVILAWLWNRVGQPDFVAREKWPRRLIYCLPMRTLVEQTHDETKKWLNAHKLLWNGTEPHADKVGLHVLMGGEDPGEWDIHPESNAILIGTQDMLLSRALNRGYGSPRARWPMHFGLLNNDALWVLDETQLMGVGVRTSAQLEGLRHQIGTAIGCATWWASATLDTRLLATPDYPVLPPSLELDENDLKDPEVSRRVTAVKRLAPLPLTLAADSAKAVDPYIEQLAKSVVERHQPDTTTIVILNRVNRASDLHAVLDKLAKKHSLPERVLVHSRFRPMEREPLSQRIRQAGPKIIIATQAIEAGVDISARTLITELAPWSSLVQRFGRCNRKGEFNESGADIFWINLQAEDEKTAVNLALPYTPQQLTAARGLLHQAADTGVSPTSLCRLGTEEPLPESHVLRRRDLIDLFDTTPDLSGLDIDVGRYIRDGDERDVQVFWRTFGKEEKMPDEKIKPQRRELVRVPLHFFRKFYDKNKTGGLWYWNVLDGEWQAVRMDRIAPGQVYLLDQALGGYSTVLGWTGEKTKDPIPVLTIAEQTPVSTPRDGQDTDDESQREKDSTQAWQSIETHTGHVIDATKSLLTALPAAAPWAEALLTAARWHDVGKAHAAFQDFLTKNRDVPPEFASTFLAKAPWKPGARHSRPHFRHELASALAWLEGGGATDPRFENLVAWLVATHHGKVRLSIRSLPGELAPTAPEGTSDNGTPLYARGIWQGDLLPDDSNKSLGLENVPASPHALPLILDLTCMQLGELGGRPSWASRMLSLRDSEEIGFFRITWLETLLRAADARGSRCN